MNSIFGEIMNKKGGVPPIVVVLVIVAFLVSAALVSWYVIATTSSAVKKPLIYAEPGAYVVGSSLYMTLRNDGTKDFSGTITVVLANGATGSQTVSIAKGEAINVVIDLTGGVFTVGESIPGIVRTPDGEQKITVEVLG